MTEKRGHEMVVTYEPSMHGFRCEPVCHEPVGADCRLAFIVQHAVHDRKGHASGLTKTGRATKAAMAALAAPTSEGDAR